jgi:uncharacterized protein (DUF1800 family)
MAILEPFKGSFDLPQAALLAQRTMFGATKTQLEAMVNQGLETILEQLFSYSLEPHPKNPFHPTSDMTDQQQVQLTQRGWLFEMLNSAEPFREKLRLFWSNHFVISIDKVRKANMLLPYLQTLYQYGLSSFEQLTLEISKTPAMLLYLDGHLNKKQHPNENFARELLELFTLGIGHYTEADVLAAARAFTGWTFDNKKNPPVFIFNEKQHDSSSKIFLGETAHSGQNIIAHCARHPATALFVSQKIWRGFVASNLDKPSIETLAQTFTETQGDLKAVFHSLFSSQVFYQSSGQMIKSPIDYVVGTLRSLEITPQEPEAFQVLHERLDHLGQVPLAPPHVAGWAGGRSWISDSTLLSRIKWAKQLLEDGHLNIDTPINDIHLVLLGQASPTHLDHLPLNERIFLLLVSPEYMVS